MQERAYELNALPVPSTGAVRSRLTKSLQRKLSIGGVNDPLEGEADRIANRVVQPGRGYNSLGAKSTGLALSRKCTCGGIGECEECQKKHEATVQRAATQPNGPAVAPAVVHDVLNSSGQPLASRDRVFFEPRFGHDFSRIRIHNDSQASASAQAVNALAYTVGRDIVFREDQYRPDTLAGRLLLAHELTHTIQQSSAPVRAANPSLMRQAAPPAYGPSCSGGVQDPCQFARCDANQNATVAGDLKRAISYVDAAVSALNRSPLESDTATTLDWFFNAHDKGTAGEVQRRLGCIRTSLADTQANNRYGCDLSEGDNILAYVCVGSTPICTDKLVNVCVTKLHFQENARTRAEVLIHECAHRVGMSLGEPKSVPDIYRFSPRFLNLSTSVALQNSDSFALFAGAITEGVRLSVLGVVGLSGGTVFTGTGSRTWQGRLYLGTEFQHPVLRIFNPTLGIGLSLIGNPGTAVTPGIPPTPTLLASLLAGVRIADPRPGGAGGPYLSLFGGPALAVGTTRTAIGAEAGVGLGYRWRWLDVSVGAGLVHDPTREPGRQNLVPITGQVLFTLLNR